MNQKILVLTSTFPTFKGGSEPPFVYELSKRLTKTFQVYLLTQYYPNSKKYEIMDKIIVSRFKYWPPFLKDNLTKNAIVPSLKKNKFFYFQAVIYSLFQIIKTIQICRKENIKIIHAHWIVPQGLSALIMKKIFNIPYIITSHGGDIFGLQGKLFTKIKYFVLKNAEIITVVSSAIEKEVIKINPVLKPKIKILPMGVDSKLFNPSKYNESLKTKYGITGPFLLFVGRLAEKKGIKYLIQAMPSIIKQFSLAKLLIIGTGGLEDELVKLTKELKLTNSVIFVGGLPNSELPQYYATADIFIGPSIKTKDGDTEGFGLTFVEASLSGCVPIGTDVGGITDIIKNKDTGYIIKSKSPKSITSAVIKILNKKTINSLNMRNKIAKKFDWDIISKKYAKLLNQVCKI